MEKPHFTKESPESKAEITELQEISADNAETLKAMNEKGLFAKLGGKWAQRIALVVALLSGVKEVSAGSFAENVAENLFHEKATADSVARVEESVELTRQNVQRIRKSLLSDEKAQISQEEYFTFPLRKGIPTNETKTVETRRKDLGGFLGLKKDKLVQENFTGVTNELFTAIVKRDSVVIDPESKTKTSITFNTEFYFDYNNDGSINRIIAMPGGLSATQEERDIFHYFGVISLKQIEETAKNIAENKQMGIPAGQEEVMLNDLVIFNVDEENSGQVTMVDVQTGTVKKYDKTAINEDYTKTSAEIIQENFEAIALAARVLAEK